MTTREQALTWLESNKYLLTSSIKFTPQQIRDFFGAYNLVTGENKAVVGCGRCILNMKHRLLSELKKQDNLQKYPLYKTEKGTLTLRPLGEQIGWIHAASDALAKEQLAVLKKEN